MAQLGELERAKALRRRAARGFGEERVDRSTLSPKDASNDNVEHAVLGCLVGLRVEVCALSALWVGLGGVFVSFLVLER
jgi:hypothetical protein